MDELVRKLVVRIWQNGRQSGIPVGQIRATKIMYLIEWEHFAWDRKRLTSLDWVFLHYGPWSSTLSDVLQRDFRAPSEEVGPGQFREVVWTPPEYDKVDTRLEVGLEGIVQRVFETFGAMPTPDIIRYVYFNTEPMRDAVRGQPLRFEATEKPFRPFNPVASMATQTRLSLRESFRKATRERLSRRERGAGSLPPDVVAFLTQLDSAGPVILPEADIEIGEEDRVDLGREG